MNKNLILIFLSAVSFALMGTALAKGNPHGGNPQAEQHPAVKATTPFVSPPGWSEGKKTGWRGASEPPGLAKKVNEPTQPDEWRKRWQNWLDKAKF